MAKKSNRLAIAPAPVTRKDFRLAGSFATAFLTGIAGLLVEVVGARALAPFFGSSLMVWTAQITATLLFLALGYELGGRISRGLRAWHLPILMFTAALWLALYPALRSPVLGIASTIMGVSSGSFLSAVVLFGLPLLCVGAASPLLVSYIDQSRPGAGSAAGSLFFISTIGGLAGGWIAVFVVIPYLSVRLCIVGTGVVLALLGVVWSIWRRSPAPAALCIGALLAGLAMGVPPSSDIVRSPTGAPVRLLYSRQSEVGLIRVIDAPAYHPVRRALLINGSLQGGISLDTHEPYTDYIRQMDRAGQFYKPDARDSLILGLGAGLLARALHARGVRVTAVDIDKRVAYAARKFFDLPPEVDVRIADARSFLRADKAKYDLIFLDVFAGENLPWYLLTVEAFKEMRSHLRENGRLVINTITNASATSPALRGTVAALHAAFPDVAVFVGRQDYGQERRFLSAGEPLLVNAVVVAGEGLRDSGQNASTVFGTQDLEEVAVNEGAQAGTRVRPGTDDRSDIDYVDVSLREEWRRLTIAEFGPDILGD